MARKRKEDADRTRARILASALSLFVKKGYEHTTFTDIAERLGLTKGAVYWYFESKEALLTALVELALQRFHRQIERLMPQGELTFLAVSEMMIRDAEVVVGDARAAGFFRLMKCQVKWTDSSMNEVRANLMNDVTVGPKEAFKRAIEHDMQLGKVRESVDAEEVATVCMALWDGLVQLRLDHFLQCDLKLTLEHAFKSVWQGIEKKSA